MRLRSTADGVELRLASGERDALAVLFEDLLVELGEGGQSGRPLDPLEALAADDDDAAQPRDPALARLFPAAYHDDAAAAAEYRRLMQSELRRGKIVAARSVVDDLARVPAGERMRLPAERVHVWVAALNDLRLLRGTRNDFGEDPEAELDGLRYDDPRRIELSVYCWLGELQAELLDAIGAI